MPLTAQKLMVFVPEMAADYEVIGNLLGEENAVRNIRTGPETVQQKMIRILEEWTGTEKASWSALIEALESYTPRLSGVASGIRLFLRKELEKGEHADVCLGLGISDGGYDATYHSLLHIKQNFLL